MLAFAVIPLLDGGYRISAQENARYSQLQYRLGGWSVFPPYLVIKFPLLSMELDLAPNMQHSPILLEY